MIDLATAVAGLLSIGGSLALAGDAGMGSQRAPGCRPALDAFPAQVHPTSQPHAFMLTVHAECTPPASMLNMHQPTAQCPLATFDHYCQI